MVVTTTKSALLTCLGPVGIGIVIVGAIAIPLIVSAATQSPPSQPSATQTRDQGNVNRLPNYRNTSNKSCRNNENKTQTGEPRRRSSSTSRRRSARVHDFESSSHDREEYSDSEEFEHRVRSPAHHIVDRILRLFRLAPLVQRVANALQMPKGDVLIPGPSMYQDHSSRRGLAFPAAHVIALSIHQDVLDHSDLECVRVLINFLGHTQNVDRFANNNRVGRRIDAMQRELLEFIINIDFSGTFAENHEFQINYILNRFKEMLLQCMEYDDIAEEEEKAYEEALDILLKMTAESVFESTKEACFGGGMDNYGEPRRDGRKRE